MSNSQRPITDLAAQTAAYLDRYAQRGGKIDLNRLSQVNPTVVK